MGKTKTRGTKCQAILLTAATPSMTRHTTQTTRKLPGSFLSAPSLAALDHVGTGNPNLDAGVVLGIAPAPPAPSPAAPVYEGM
jgi:hypothetical protein